MDSHNNKALPFATIQLKSTSGKFYGTSSDADGLFSIANIKGDSYQLTISYIGYKTYDSIIVINQNVTHSFRLSSASTDLKDVVITASESKGITSASKIDRTAMEHLQPSSFTDILSLLPGGSTATPDMSKANTIRLREVGIGSSDYNTSSLGTQFIVDGTPISTNANMQSVASDISSAFDGYSSVNAGVDMRNISTDNIESVEIIRGIPSVQYENLTSGAVIIKRKQNATPIEARFKADQSSKLFSVGKGFEWKERNILLSADIGYLDAKNDPRDRYDRYKRVNASLRFRKIWALHNGYRWVWNVNTDYSGNVDNVKNDPNIEKLQEDSYYSSYHKGGWHNTIDWVAPSEKFFRKLSIYLSADMSWDQIKRTRFIQLDRDRTAPTNMEEGEHDATILPYTYTAHALVDGNPLNIYTKISAEFKGQTWGIHHKILTGTTFVYDKNLGDGQVYDLTRPLDPTTGYYRPRKYSDIPASEQWRMYVEDNMSMNIGNHSLDIQAGVGSNMILNLNDKYTLSGKMYIDPRFNGQWKFPGIDLGSNEMKFDLSGGVGWLTLMPTLSQLYPNNIYLDFTQLSYWNSNAAYKRVNLRTYIINPTNYNLKPARNFKWEMRLGMDYHKNVCSITYFRERMNSGFRSMAVYAPYEYKKYNSDGVDDKALTAPPSLDNMPYSLTSVLRGYGQTGNGSRILKEGVEFQLSTERFKSINTRFTINGAWLRSTYENSQPVFQAVSAVINGTALSDKYIGLYEVDDSYLREQFNTNFIIDTYLSKLGLKFSATAECLWFYAQQSPKQSGTPIAYMDISGTVYPYTEADKDDIYKQQLIMSTSQALQKRNTTPFYMYINFKATKDFGKVVSISLFADRILDCVPDYRRNGYLIRRTAASPYFGMELNLKI